MRTLAWLVGLSVLLLAAGAEGARADIPPPTACSTKGERCRNAGEDAKQPGVCAEQTCQRFVPDMGKSIDVPCMRCVAEGGEGGSAAQADAGSSGVAPAKDPGAAGKAAGGAGKAAGGAGKAADAAGGRASAAGKSANAAGKGGSSALPTAAANDDGGCNVVGLGADAAGLPYLWLFGAAWLRRRRGR